VRESSVPDASAPVPKANGARRKGSTPGPTTTACTRHDCALARSLPASPIYPACAVFECGILAEDDSARRFAIWIGSSARSLSGSGLVSRSAAARPSHCCLLDATPISGRCVLDTTPAPSVSVRVDPNLAQHRPATYLLTPLSTGPPLFTTLTLDCLAAPEAVNDSRSYCSYCIIRLLLLQR